MSAGAAACALYPTSRSVADLADPFRGAVTEFLRELALAGCTVEIHATRRPLERAFLMHYAWLVSRRELDPSAVPSRLPDGRPAPAIAWTVEGAAAMVAVYELVHEPSLTSRHIEGRAVDVTITGWKGTPGQLYALGASCGVRKLVSDPPHWSDDGH